MVFFNIFMVNILIIVMWGFGVVILVDFSLGYELYYSFVEKYLFIVVVNVGLDEVFV